MSGNFDFFFLGILPHLSLPIYYRRPPPTSFYLTFTFFSSSSSSSSAILATQMADSKEETRQATQVEITFSRIYRKAILSLYP